MGTGPLGRSSIPGKRGRTGAETRLPRVDPLCSLKVARASKISGRKFSAVARRKPTGLIVCRNGCADDAMRRPVLASSSPRSIRSQSGSTLGRRAHRHRIVPACWQAQHVPVCRCWEKSARLQASARTRTPRSCDLFHPRGHTAMARQRGTELRIVAAEACGAVFRANGDRPPRVVRLPMADSLCDRMERGEEEALVRAAAVHLRAPILQTLRRVRLPTSDRRKFPSGNFRSARDLEGAKRVSRGQAYRQTSTVPRLPERPYGTPPPPQPSRSVPGC